MSAVEPNWRLYEGDADNVVAHPTAKRQLNGLVVPTPFRWTDPAFLPAREWLVGQHPARGFVSVTGAAGGTGKSALLTTECLSLVTGRPLLGDSVPSLARVWYVGLEDPLTEYQRRFAAAALHHHVAPADLEARLFLDSGREQAFVIAREERGSTVICEPFVNAVIQHVMGRDIAYVVVDPFVACHRVGESDNTKIDEVARQWAKIADVTNSAIELVHHVKKGTHGNEPHMDDLRGASALVSASRSTRVLTPMSNEEALKAGIEHPRRFFRVQGVKGNNSTPDSQRPVWRQLVSVDLGNGDSVGVVDKWRWPSAFAGLPPDVTARVQDKIASGKYRKDPQSADWAGHAIAEVTGLHVGDLQHRARIKGMLSSWLKDGHLMEVRRPDEKRNVRPFIEVGTPAAPHLKLVSTIGS